MFMVHVIILSKMKDETLIVLLFNLSVLIEVHMMIGLVVERIFMNEISVKFYWKEELETENIFVMMVLFGICF